MSLNVVTLTGRLTKDIDLKYTASGTAVGSFILAVNRNFTDQNGEKKVGFRKLCNLEEISRKHGEFH